jgi:hypothetical protein
METDVDKPKFNAYGDLKVENRFSHRKAAPLSFPYSHTPVDTPPPKSQLHQVVYYGRIQRNTSRRMDGADADKKLSYIFGRC